MSKPTAVKTKHVPLRTCIATGEKHPKGELMRLVRVGDEAAGYAVEVDIKGKKAGRGASLLPTVEAFDLAIKKGAIERGLNLGRRLNAAEVIKLKTEFDNAIWEKQFRNGNQKVVLKISKQELAAKLGD